MARKLRTEAEGGLYHVINRGNYRTWVFADDGAKAAFEKALFETCERTGWVLHAWCIMGNHFHLGLETPRGNLSEGMRWLQSVFAHRFNRHRKESGRLFQGRFKSIAVEDAARMGAVCHYIHLNPVRAGICPVETLPEYRWSSCWFLERKRSRPVFLDLSCALEGAGGTDTPTGRRGYLAYLAWLAGDTTGQKELGFERMSRGWAIGTDAFRKALAGDERKLKATVRLDRQEAREARALVAEGRLQACVQALGKGDADLTRDSKAAPWKVAVAAYLKRRLLASNAWIAQRLHMGALFGVSRYVSELEAGRRPEAAELLARLTARIKE